MKQVPGVETYSIGKTADFIKDIKEYYPKEDDSIYEFADFFAYSLGTGVVSEDDYTQLLKHTLLDIFNGYWIGDNKDNKILKDKLDKDKQQYVKMFEYFNGDFKEFLKEKGAFQDNILAHKKLSQFIPNCDDSYKKMIGDLLQQ